MPSQLKRKFQKENESIFDCNKDNFLLPIDEGNDDKGIGEDEENQVSDSEWQDVESETEHQEVTCDSHYVGSSHGDSITSGKKNDGKKKSKGRTSVISGKVARHKAAQNLVETRTKAVSGNNNIDLDGDDISDEEDLRNTVGNIPINWYDEFDHIGYGLDALRLVKPYKGDSLDRFLQKVEGHEFGKLIYDKQTGQDIKLTDDDVNLVKRLIAHQVPSSNYDMYAPFLDLYSHEVMEMPVNAVPASKKSFIPSKFERQKVARLALLIRKGLYPQINKKSKTGPKEFYDIWKSRNENDLPLRRLKNHLMSPLEIPPTHSVSYNPPPEYLILNPNKVDRDGNVKKLNIHPFVNMWRKFPSVRDIPSYRLTIKERLSRLTKLYMAHRKQTKWNRATSQSLLPKIPSKKDLRPFPSMLGDSFVGHKSIIRSISIHPCGKYLASGSDDQTVKVWEVTTGRCLQTFTMNHLIQCVAWNPNPNLFLLAIAVNQAVVMLNPETYLTDKIVVQQTNAIFKEEVDQGDYIVPARVEGVVTWRKPTPTEWALGFRVVLDHFQEVREVVWHSQGDYFVTLMPQGLLRSVAMHQLSRWRSQLPFQSNKGRVQACSFHPKEPLFFIANQSSIKVYNLKTRKLFKKIKANSRWLSCIAVHPGGSHFIAGGYDCKINWFELEYTTRPRPMKYHTGALRSVKYHRKYPLFATASDDHKLLVAHGSVFDDLGKDPQIILLRRLTGHSHVNDYYVFDVEWHPFEPFLFSAGADGTIKLWH